MPRKITVSDPHRKNELSLEPGGVTITLIHKNGDRLIYDKIKNARAYAKRAQMDEKVEEIWCGDELIWKRKNG